MTDELDKTLLEFKVSYGSEGEWFSSTLWRISILWKKRRNPTRQRHVGFHQEGKSWSSFKRIEAYAHN